MSFSSLAVMSIFFFSKLLKIIKPSKITRSHTNYTHNDRQWTKVVRVLLLACAHSQKPQLCRHENDVEDRFAELRVQMRKHAAKTRHVLRETLISVLKATIEVLYTIVCLARHVKIYSDDDDEYFGANAGCVTRTIYVLHQTSAERDRELALQVSNHRVDVNSWDRDGKPFGDTTSIG